MRMVYCTFKLVGYHQYVGAPKEVQYLEDLHRHEFNFKVSVEVSHDNREIEFHMLKRWCINKIFQHYAKEKKINKHAEFHFGEMSCEMIADWLLQELVSIKTYNVMLGTKLIRVGKTDEEKYELVKRQIIVEVSEDGENGGVVTRL